MRMPYLETLHRTEATWRRQPTRPNLFVTLKHQGSLLFGNLGHHRSASFSHDSSFRTEFGLQIGWRVEIGTTTQLTPLCRTTLLYQWNRHAGARWLKNIDLGRLDFNTVRVLRTTARRWSVVKSAGLVKQHLHWSTKVTGRRKNCVRMYLCSVFCTSSQNSTFHVLSDDVTTKLTQAAYEPQLRHLILLLLIRSSFWTLHMKPPRNPRWML
jgi:hypothetical protein